MTKTELCTTLKDAARKKTMEFHARLSDLLSHVQFEGYKFLILEENGVTLIQGVYDDADVYTKEVQPQYTRKWAVDPKQSNSQIVQTVFKLCLTSYEHRVREGFLYKRARVFGPHFDVEDLVKLCHSGRENAGGPD